MFTVVRCVVFLLHVMWAELASDRIIHDGLRVLLAVGLGFAGNSVGTVDLCASVLQIRSVHEA